MRFIFGLICSLLILSFSGLGLAQSTPDASTETGRPVNGFKEGVWKSYYPNSKSIHYQGSYRHGKRVGKWVWKYRNGAIKETQEYQNGSKHGIWVSYLRNGVTQSSGQFKKGLRFGHWTVRDAKGILVRNGIYSSGGFTGKVYNQPTKDKNITTEYYENYVEAKTYETPKYRKHEYRSIDVIGAPKYMTDGLVATMVYTKSKNRLIETETCHYLNGLRHGTCLRRTTQGKVIGHGLFKKGKYVKGINEMNPKEDGNLDRRIRNILKKKKLQYAIPKTNQFKPKTTSTNKP